MATDIVNAANETQAANPNVVLAGTADFTTTVIVVNVPFDSARDVYESEDARAQAFDQECAIIRDQVETIAALKGVSVIYVPVLNDSYDVKTINLVQTVPFYAQANNG